MEIFFITGKGGVGKSAVAAAKAVSLAQAGMKTLLVELGNQSFYKSYLNKPDISYNPSQLQKNLDLSLWTGEESLKEYVLHLIKIESLYNLFFENKVSRSLIQIAPALSELAILGKITSGPPRYVGPLLDYDSIVVDSYSSGHFLALLNAPKGMAEAIGFGPMGEQSKAIHQIICDNKIVRYIVVSLPEELPVAESIELSDKIQSLTGVQPSHYLNRCFLLEQKSFEQEKEVPLKFKEYVESILKRQSSLEKRYNEKKLRVEKLPWVFQQDGWQVIQGISNHIERLNEHTL